MKNTLKAATSGDREIIVTRQFNAPRELVYEAMCRPELLKRWLLGPPGWTMTVCENDVRVGGAFRHAWVGPQGEAMAMHGVYREVDAPHRVVRTEIFEIGCDGQCGEQLATAALTELNGKTTLTIHIVFPSTEARDATIRSGMEHGMAAGYERLEELLAGQAAK